MERPDKDEILKRIPDSERRTFEQIEKQLAELREAGTLKPRSRGGTTSPYGGQRLITDNHPEAVDLNREGYGLKPISN